MSGVEAGLEVDVHNQTIEHRAFELALITDEPLILFRRQGWLRWEASLWEAERVETAQATYIYAKLIKIGMGSTRGLARRALS